MDREKTIRPDRPQRESTRREFLKACGVAPFILCGVKAAPARARPRVIVLLVMDTVRADRMGYAGYRRNTTPFLDKLAARSGVFDQVYATSCWTVPSHGSLFSGLYPIQHGAHMEHLHLDTGFPTLAELLGEAGYRTVGVTENQTVSGAAGFSRGFDDFVERDWKIGGDPDVTLQRVTKMIRGFESGGEPLFLFVNLMAAHAPYDSAGPFKDCFVSDPAYKGRPVVANTRHWLEGKIAYTDEELVHLAEHYDEEVRFVDSQVERIVTALEEAGLYRDAVLCVTSDHGESLGEHGMLGHQLCLYETLVRVPLLLRAPWIEKPTRYRAPYSLLDVTPSLLSAAGIDPAAYELEGVQLPPLSGTDPEHYARPILMQYFEPYYFTRAEYEQEWSSERLLKYKRRLKALRRGDFKLIEGSDGSRELYHLGLDADESKNLATDEKHRMVLDRMDAALRDMETRLSPRGGGKGLSTEDRQEMEERMRALGYI